MKILMIAPTPFFSHRGTHIRILEEARALERLGHNITIVTYHIGDDIGKYIDTTISVRRIRRWLFWYKKTEAGPDWQKVILNIFLIKKTFSLIRTWQPDVIHAHLHEGVIIARIMQWVFFWKKIPVVADFHGSLVGEMRSHGYLGVLPVGTIFRALERWINGMGDAAIVSGEENVAMISAARKDARARHICDGVNVHAYGKENDRSALRKRYDISQDAFVIVYTGALIANKGIDHVLHAIASVVSRIPSAHFVIGGYPDRWVREYVTENQLDDHVTIISPLNYFVLPEVNMLGDIAVDPKDASVQQASGKILQYMAAHMGIICADRPTNRKYLNNESAQFLPFITSDALTEAIEKFYLDRAYLLRSADGAYRDAMRFSWDKIGVEIESVYDAIIDREKYGIV